MKTILINLHSGKKMVSLWLKSSLQKMDATQKKGCFCRESPVPEELAASQSVTEKSPERLKFLPLCPFWLLLSVLNPIQINQCDKIWGYFCTLIYSL